MTQTVDIQALDISNCGLSDLALRDIFEVLYHQGKSLQSLDVSGNRGRVQASLVATLSQTIYDLRKLNVSGIIMGDIPGPLFSFETLSRFEYLEELDLSKVKVNDATLNALEMFLSQKPTPSQPLLYVSQDDSPVSNSTFRKLALNNCGINGREAARLVRALANHSDAHLHIAGNPLDEGVEDLCRALAFTPGPAGLHMDMIEFRHEGSFVALMKALTVNKHITFLSMAGTAPTPSADGPCGPEVCEALEAFFEGNKSVRYLDLSGYSGKLDEGQLAPGFARSLRGLAANDTLTHLRIRNQNLHDDVGTLGSVIRQNDTLRMVDCQENSWNLTSIQFLVKSLRLNTSIVEFPFPHAEFERVWVRVVADIRRQSSGAGRAAALMQNEQENVLRATLLRQVHELCETVERNRGALEGSVPFAVDFEDSTATGGNSGWPSLQLRIPSGSGSGSSSNNTRRLSKPAPLAHVQKLRKGLNNPQHTASPARLLDFDLDSDIMVTPVDTPPSPTTSVTRKVHEVPEVGSHAENPYHVGHDADAQALLKTPPGALSPNDGDDEGGGNSPTDPEMPLTPTASVPESESGSEAGTKVFDSGLLMRSDAAGVVAATSETRMLSSVGGFDMGPYFGSGRDFAVGRFRVGGLEAHEEE